MKILNLFAGIGGNRTLWGNKHEITAIEYNEIIANIYEKRFPDDNLIVCDAYEYFIDNFHNFDILWASPPCTSHTILTGVNVGNRYNNKNVKLKIPDLRLYSLILFCKHYFRGNYIIENVKGYYKPLISPTTKIGRHWIWSNIEIPKTKQEKSEHVSREDYNEKIEDALIIKGISKEIYNDLLKLDIMTRKQIINNCIVPEEGKHILDCLTNQTKLKSKEIWKYFK